MLSNPVKQQINTWYKHEM